MISILVLFGVLTALFVLYKGLEAIFFPEKNKQDVKNVTEHKAQVATKNEMEEDKDE